MTDDLGAGCALLTDHNTFLAGGTWLQPLTVVTARMVRISAEFTC